MPRSFLFTFSFLHVRSHPGPTWRKTQTLRPAVFLVAFGRLVLLPPALPTAWYYLITGPLTTPAPWLPTLDSLLLRCEKRPITWIKNSASPFDFTFDLRPRLRFFTCSSIHLCYSNYRKISLIRYSGKVQMHRHQL